LVALPTRASTASRLSADRHSITSQEPFASTIFFEVNWRNFSCVSSIAKIVSENTMQDAVSSQNISFFFAPIDS
jgi:hypothetical protein